MQIEGAAVVIFRSRRAEGMKKNRAGVQGRHFLRIKTLGKGRKKRRGKGNEDISHALARLIRKMSDRMVFRCRFVVILHATLPIPTIKL